MFYSKSALLFFIFDDTQIYNTTFAHSMKIAHNLLWMFGIVLAYLHTNSFLVFQYVTEKMGGAEGTKLDLDFMEMERVSW